MAIGASMRLASARARTTPPTSGETTTTSVGVVLILDVAREDWSGEQVVGRDVEEALDLAGVEIEREDAVGAGAFDQVGDEFGRNRRARSGFAILAGVAVIGNDGRDALGGGALQSVDQDQQFHQVVVRRERRRLEDEYVLAADVLLDFDEDLHVGEALHLPFGERSLDVSGDGFGEGAVGIAGHEPHARMAPVPVVSGIERHDAPLAGMVCDRRVMPRSLARGWRRVNRSRQHIDG